MKGTCLRFVAFSLAALSLLFGGRDVFPADSSAPVAIVKKMGGNVTLIREGQPILVRNGLEILMNDTLRTGRDGSIGIIFKDETFLSLGPETTLVIDEFVFAPKQGRFSIVITLLKGTAAYLSGLISKFSPESAHFRTPTASIGIRGTRFVVKVEGE